MDKSGGVSKAEQLAIVIRHVDSDFHIHEQLLDIYGVTDMTGAAIAMRLEETLEKMANPFAKLSWSSL